MTWPAPAGQRAADLLNEFGVRRLHQPPVLVWSVVFIIGIALRLANAGPAVLGAAIALTALFGMLSAWQTPEHARLRRLSIVLLAFAPLPLLAGHWHAGQHERPEAWIDALAEQEVLLTGIAQRDGEQRRGQTELWIRGESVHVADEGAETSALFLVRAAPGLKIEAGDRVRARAVLESAAAIEGGFAGYLEREGVSAVGRADTVQFVNHPGLGWWRDAVADVRRAIDDSLQAALPPPINGIAQAMVTGRDSAIDPALREEFARSGIIHLVVVSGANVHLLAALIFFSTTWAIGRRWGTVLVIAAIVPYAFIAAGDPVSEPPVFRASVMAAVLLIAISMGRRTGAIYAIALAAAILAALSPAALASPSFQLTLAGTLAVASVAPAAMMRFYAGGSGRRVVLDFVLINFVACLATLPVIALHFDRLSLVALPANLAAAPVFTWMFAGAAATGLLGLAGDWIPSVFAWLLAGVPLSWLALVAELAAAPSWASLSPPREAIVFMFAAIAVIVLASFPAAERYAGRPTGQGAGRMNFAAAAVVAVFLATAAAVVWARLDAAADDRRLAVHFLDVGQGDAALIHTPAGRTLLIDGGPDGDQLLAQLRAVLPPNHAAIDAILLTHPQADHANGLFTVLERYSVGTLIVSPFNDEARLGQRLEEAAKDRGVSVQTAQAGDEIDLDPKSKVRADILWPPLELSDGGRDPNAASLVLRLIYGKTAFLFTGDIRATEEVRLARTRRYCGNAPCDLRADVLKVAHQGAKSSSSDLFLRRVQPDLAVAVISAGAGNPHGHPHEEAVKRIEEASESIFRTFENGTISVFSDGASISHRTSR